MHPDSARDLAREAKLSSAPPRRTLIIGDVHGCLDELKNLLKLSATDAAPDQIILVGDLVAKGPDSQGVILFARERGMRAVLGNHDAKVLTFAPGVTAAPRTQSPKQHEAVARTLTPDDWRYLQGLPLTLSLPEFNTVVVHGGLVFGVPFDQQPRDLVINMRSITPDGQPSKHVEAGVPWASVWPGPTHVVFGHDAVRGLQQHRFATGLDTGCVYGRRLTGLLLPDHRLISVPSRRPHIAF
ncbi:MAG: metallophosphoesterase [Myxococcales bacterium]